MKSTEEGVSSSKRGGGKGLFTVILLLLVVVSAGSATYFYMQLQDLKANPQAVQGEEQVAELLAEVGELIVLPENEQPTVATVSDVERLRDQPFFANAKNGDRVLIYTDARKAILYDPVAKKIVEVAPVNIGEAATPPEDTGDGTFEEIPSPEEE